MIIAGLILIPAVLFVLVGNCDQIQRHGHLAIARRICGGQHAVAGWSRRGESQNRKPDPDLNLISGAAVVAKPKASLRALGYEAPFRSVEPAKRATIVSDSILGLAPQAADPGRASRLGWKSLC